jgi:hypothetical protein
LLFFIDSFEDGERGHSDSERPTEVRKKKNEEELDRRNAHGVGGIGNRVKQLRDNRYALIWDYQA